MTKKIINVGTEPGDQGDGDSLRDAFIKSQSNFDELYSFSPITDTSLDHSNPDVAGTIAEALAACEAAGGGTVSVGPGVFILSIMTLTIGKNCQLIGSGKNATELRAEHQIDAIEISGGAIFKPAYWSIKDLSVSLSSSNSGNAVSTNPEHASIGTIKNLLVTGGSQDSWGLDMNAVNGISVIDYTYKGEGNGIRWRNQSTLPINYGDSLIQNADIILRNSFTTGILLASPTHFNNNRYRINNVLLSLIVVRSKEGIVNQGTVGIHLINAARCTIDHADIENMDTGVVQESAVDGGAIAKGNAFYQIHSLGCTTDYTEIGSPPIKQIVLGGSGYFSDNQQFPNSNIVAEHNILGKNRILTAVRPIEAYSDSTTPRILTVQDSGTIFTNKGATDTVTFNLPPADNSFSFEYEFHLATAGFAIRIQPSLNDLIRPGQDSNIEVYESDIVFGQVLKIRNIDGTTWSTLSEVGAWTSF